MIHTKKVSHSIPIYRKSLLVPYKLTNYQKIIIKNEVKSLILENKLNPFFQLCCQHYVNMCQYVSTFVNIMSIGKKKT